MHTNRMNEPIHVLVADDHSILRRGLVEIIHEAFPLAIIGEARDGEEALRKCLAEAWDLVILDIQLPKLTGFGVLHQLKRHKSDLRVIILSSSVPTEYVTHALEF